MTAKTPNMGINDLTRVSPGGLFEGGGLICFKKILHGGLFEKGGLFEGEGLIEALRYLIFNIKLDK